MKPTTLTIRVSNELKVELRDHVKKLSQNVGFPVSLSTFIREIIIKSLKSGR